MGQETPKPPAIQVPPSPRPQPVQQHPAVVPYRPPANRPLQVPVRPNLGPPPRDKGGGIVAWVKRHKVIAACCVIGIVVVGIAICKPEWIFAADTTVTTPGDTVFDGGGD